MYIQLHIPLRHYIDKFIVILPLSILLDALAAMGLLVKQGGSYQTEPSTTRLLAADSPNTILPIIQHNIDLCEQWGRLTGKVAGALKPDRSMRAFIGAMHVIGRPLAVRIVKLVDPAGARQLIDVRGGSGTYTLAFLEAAPQMRATIFDRPEVIEMARERVGAAGMLDRVALVAGDFNRDPLPVGTTSPSSRRSSTRIQSSLRPRQDLHAVADSIFGMGDHPFLLLQARKDLRRQAVFGFLSFGIIFSVPSVTPPSN